MIESQYFPFAQNLLLSPWSPLKSCMVISQQTLRTKEGSRITVTLHAIIRYMKKLLSSDWLR